MNPMKDFSTERQSTSSDWLVSRDQIQPLSQMNYLPQNNFQNANGQRFTNLNNQQRAYTNMYNVNQNMWQSDNHMVNMSNPSMSNMPMQYFPPNYVYPQFPPRDMGQRNTDSTNVYIVKPLSGEPTLKDVYLQPPDQTMKLLQKYENEPILKSTGESQEMALEKVKKMALKKYEDSQRFPGMNFGMQQNANLGYNNMQTNQQQQNYQSYDGVLQTGLSDDYINYYRMMPPSLMYQNIGNVPHFNQIMMQNQLIQQHQQQQQQQQQQQYTGRRQTQKSRASKFLKPHEPPVSSMSGILDPSSKLPTPAPEKITIEEARKNDNWVRCDNRSCRKWRRLPDYIDPGTLPPKWYCSLNRWDKNHCTCDAEEEEDDLQLLAKTRMGKQTKATPVQNHPIKRESTIIAGINRDTYLKPFDWLRCENPQCRKWRKLPPTVSPSEIPQPFYCVMNYWNFSLSSCDAPQEYNFEYEKGSSSSFGTPSRNFTNSPSISKEEDEIDQVIKRAKKNGLTVSKRGRIIKKARWLIREELSDPDVDEFEYGPELCGADIFLKMHQREDGKQARVVKYNPRKKEHLVEYDDGSQQTVRLSDYQVDIIRTE